MIVRSKAWGQPWGPTLLSTSALLITVIFVLPLKLTGGCTYGVDGLTFLIVLTLAGSGVAWLLLWGKEDSARAKVYWSVLAAVLSLIFLMMPPIPLLDSVSIC